MLPMQSRRLRHSVSAPSDCSKWPPETREGQIMNAPTGQRNDLPWQCPACDAKLAAEPAMPTHDAPCPERGYYLWCRKRMVDDVAVLDILPDRIPERPDIERLVESLVGSGGVPRAVLDLSRLQFIVSLLLAKLVVLSREMQRNHGRLILYGLQPVVRDTLASTKLDTILEIADDEEAALAGLQAENPRRDADEA